MTRIEELEAQAKELSATIAKLKAEQEAKKVWPQEGDEFWLVDGALSVQSHTYGANTYSSYPTECVALGNCFRTREAAEREAHAKQVVAKLRMSAGRKAFVPKQPNYSPCPDFDTVYPESWSRHDLGWQSIYFDTRESTQAAIDSIGAEEILKASRWLAIDSLQA